jgi:hypothetical protein
MWSTPEDRDRAAVRAERLTPAQLRKRDELWQAFSVGFDAATLFFADRIAVPVDLTQRRHVETKKTAFEQWDEQVRITARKAKTA